MAKHLCQFAETIGPNLTAAQLETLSGLASRLVATASDNSSNQERARIWGYCEVYYAMAGMEDQLNSVFEQIQDERPRRFGFDYYSSFKPIFELLARLIDHQELTQKIATLDRYLAMSGVGKALRQRQSGAITHLHRHGVLSEEEVLGHTDELFNLGDRTERNWAQIARLQQTRGMIKEAEVSWHRSIQACASPGPTWSRIKTYCLFLQEVGRAQDALAYVQRIDTEGWSTKLKQQRQTWFADWKVDKTKQEGKQVSKQSSSERSNSVSRQYAKFIAFQ